VNQASFHSNGSSMDDGKNESLAISNKMGILEALIPLLKHGDLATQLELQ